MQIPAVLLSSLPPLKWNIMNLSVFDVEHQVLHNVKHFYAPTLKEQRHLDLLFVHPSENLLTKVEQQGHLCPLDAFLVHSKSDEEGHLVVLKFKVILKLLLSAQIAKQVEQSRGCQFSPLAICIILPVYIFMFHYRVESLQISEQLISGTWLIWIFSQLIRRYKQTFTVIT